MSIQIRNFGKSTLRSQIEASFAGLVFAATAVFYVGGTLALLVA